MCEKVTISDGRVLEIEKWKMENGKWRMENNGLFTHDSAIVRGTVRTGVIEVAGPAGRQQRLRLQCRHVVDIIIRGLGSPCR